jgi:hypothetical protein
LTGILWRTDGSAARGVEVDGTYIEADAVVIAMEPWSHMASEWRLPSEGQQRITRCLPDCVGATAVAP